MTKPHVDEISYTLNLLISGWMYTDHVFGARKQKHGWIDKIHIAAKEIRYLIEQYIQISSHNQAALS